MVGDGSENGRIVIYAKCSVVWCRNSVWEGG